MPKVKFYEVDPKEKRQVIENFYEIISEFKNKKEIVDFYAGLFTPSENLMIARRIQIAQMILNGKSYDEIRKKIKTSNQTITKTDQWLHSGDDNYDKWIQELLMPKQKQKKSSKKARNKYYENILDRYPQHRFLKELFK